MVDITNPIFHDEDKAVAHLEASRWPHGPFCPHCGSTNVHRMEGKTQAGYFLCNDCRDKFTARVGSVMERSHIPIHKWLLAMHLIAASKKGISSKQLERMLNVSYKSAWFLSMRIREAMRVAGAQPIGGEGKIVESDETFVGGKKKNVHKGKPEPKKHAVHALVERGEALTYYYLGKEFAKHCTVNHSQDEYFKDGAGVQSAEAFFAILKRGVMARSTASAKRICKGTATSSRSAGTTAHRSASRIQSAPQNCSRASLASA